MAAWNDAPAAGGLGECAALVRSAEALRSSAPELAVQLARRALAVGAEAAKAADLAETKSLSMRAQAVLASGLIRLSRYAEAVDPAFAALALAEGEGVADVATALRLDLAACTPEIGEPLLGCALLRPVLEAPRPGASVRAVALGRLVGCVAHVGRRDDVEDALAEADRLLAADEALSPDLRRLERAQLSVRSAAYHRWYGDTEDAADAAREGLTQLNRLRGLRPEMARLRARLVLELACALLDEGALDEAASVSESVLAEPVRATSADAVGRLMLAVSTRVYLPSGRVDRGRGLLDQAVWVAGRHGLDGLLADVLTAVSQLDEAAERPVEALESLRIARAAEKRRLRGISLATRRLLTEASPATWDAKAVNVLLRSVLRAAEAQPATQDWHLAAQRVIQPPNRTASSVQGGQRPESDEDRYGRGDRPAFSGGELVAPRMNQSAAEQLAAERLAAKQSAAEQPQRDDDRSADTAQSVEEAAARSSEALADWTSESARPAGELVSAVVDRMHDQAETDAATGLLNKDGLIRRLRAVRDGDRPVALTLVRLDGYTNPGRFAGPGTHPNAAADFELSELAGRVRDIAPGDAELARSDGSELAVLLPHTTRDQAEKFATEVESVWLGTASGHGISTGVVQSNPDAPTVDARALINAARHALTPAVPAPSGPLPPSTTDEPEAPADPGDTLRVGRAIISSLSIPAGSGGKRRADDPDAHGEPASHPDNPATADTPPAPHHNEPATTITASGTLGTTDSAPTTSPATPGTSDLAPDTTDLAPSMRDVAPSPADLAPGPADTTPGTSDMASGTADTAPGTSDLAPDTADLAPGIRDLAPGLREMAPSMRDMAPSPADLAPGQADTTPGTSDVASGTADMAPGTRETTHGPAGMASGTADTAPGTWDTVPGSPDADFQPAATVRASGTLGTADTASTTPAATITASGTLGAPDTAPAATGTAPAAPGAEPAEGPSTYEQTKAELARLMSALTDGKGTPPPEETRDFEPTPLPAPSRPTEDNLRNGMARPSQTIPTPPAPDEIPEPERRPDIPDPGEPDPIPPAPPDPGPQPPDEPNPPSAPSRANEPSRGPRNLAAAFGTTSQITAETFAEVRAGTYIQTYADPPASATAYDTAAPHGERPAGDSGPNPERPAGDATDFRVEQPAGEAGDLRVEQPAGDAADLWAEQPVGDAAGPHPELSAAGPAGPRPEPPADGSAGTRPERSAGDAGPRELPGGGTADSRAEPADGSPQTEAPGRGTVDHPAGDAAVADSGVGSEPRAGKVETVGGAEVVPIVGTNRRPSMAAVFGGRSDDVARGDSAEPGRTAGAEPGRTAGAEPELTAGAEPGLMAGAEPERATGGERESRAERSSGSTTIAGLLAEALAAYQETDEAALDPRPTARDSRRDSARNSWQGSTYDSRQGSTRDGRPGSARDSWRDSARDNRQASTRDSRAGSTRDGQRDGRPGSPPDSDFDRLFDWTNQSSASGRHRSPE